MGEIIDSKRQKGLKTLNKFAKLQLNKLNIKRTRSYVVLLHSIGKELGHLCRILETSPESESIYSKRIFHLLRKGNDSLKKLIDEFERVGLLTTLYNFFILIKYPKEKFTEENFPIEEKKLFEKMGLTEDEISLMIKIMNELMYTPDLSVDKIFEISQEELARIYEISDIDKKKRIKYQAYGGFKVISGASFAGLNLLGYFATKGILIDLYNTMASFLAGVAFMESGRREFRKE